MTRAFVDGVLVAYVVGGAAVLVCAVMSAAANAPHAAETLFRVGQASWNGAGFIALLDRLIARLEGG